MCKLTGYIDSLVEGNADNYEINFKDGVYVVTVILDLSDRPEVRVISNMLIKITTEGVENVLKRYLPRNLFVVDNKVLGREIDVKLTYPDDIRIPIYVDMMNDIQPLNTPNVINMSIDYSININDISTFVTYDY